MSRRPTLPPAARRRGFTLNELLIVIAIAVLLLALAVPAFNAITGGRSVESAENQVSSFLATARAEAIGLQEPRGVIFFVDPGSEQVAAAQVYFPPDRLPPNNRPNDRQLELFGDRDEILLPKGIGIRVLPNGRVNSTNAGVPEYRLWRTYGVVMFDGHGRLIQEPVQVPKDSALARRIDADPGTPPADPVLVEETDRYKDPNAPINAQAQTITRGPLSNIGFVLYDDIAYRELGGADAEKDRWLQENAVPFMVNRYNGTLLRGE